MVKNGSLEKKVDLFYLGMKDYDDSERWGYFGAGTSRHTFYCPELNHGFLSRWGSDFNELWYISAYSSKSETGIKIKKEFEKRVKEEKLFIADEYYESKHDGRYYPFGLDAEQNLRVLEVNKNRLVKIIKSFSQFLRSQHNLEKIEREIRSDYNFWILTHPRCHNLYDDCLRKISKEEYLKIEKDQIKKWGEKIK